MTDASISFLLSSVEALISAFEGLLVPAAAFSLLAMLMRGRRIFGDLRRGLPEIGLNLQIMAFNVAFVVPMVVTLSTFLSGTVRQNGLSLVPAEVWAQMPVWLVAAIAIAAGDFFGYWRHRLEHTAVLWPAHAVHHSDTAMTWTAIERFHPINRVTTFLFDSLGLLLLGLPPFAIIANALVRHYYGAFIHADLPWTYGPLGRIFVSPAMHRWHHAADVKAFDTNFATVFSIWDRMFGTCLAPGPCDPPLGVTDEMERNLVGQLSYPFLRRAYPTLFRRTGAATAERVTPRDAG
ncbi:MAG: sterol desaturase family protein [Paracoccaceae bacterium]